MSYFAFLVLCTCWQAILAILSDPHLQAPSSPSPLPSSTASPCASPPHILSASREPLAIKDHSGNWASVPGTLNIAQEATTLVSWETVKLLNLEPEENDNLVVRPRPNGPPQLYPRIWLEVCIKQDTFHVLGAVGGDTPTVIGADILNCLFDKGFALGVGQLRSF